MRGPASGVGGLLDRYVLRRFAGAYGLCLGGFVLLFLVISFFGKLDNFLGADKAIEKAGLSMTAVMLRYFVTITPWIVATIGPFLTLFAAIATLVTFARHNEMTPMVVAGRSPHRVLAPIYAAGVLLVLALALTEEYVVPSAMRSNQAIDRLISGGERGDVVEPQHLRDVTTGNVVIAKAWSSTRATLVDVHAPLYRDRDAAGRPRESMLDAAELVWRTHEGRVGWYARDGSLTPTDVDRDGRLAEPVRVPPDAPIEFRLTPDEINLLCASRETGLDRQQLHSLITRWPERSGLWMQLLTRTTRPVSSLVLLLLGLPFVAQSGKKSIAQGLAVALATCASYQAVALLFEQFGNRGDLTPMVAAWFAPCLFGAVGLARLDRIAR